MVIPSTINTQSMNDEDNVGFFIDQLFFTTNVGKVYTGRAVNAESEVLCDISGGQFSFADSLGGIDCHSSSSLLYFGSYDGAWVASMDGSRAPMKLSFTDGWRVYDLSLDSERNRLFLAAERTFLQGGESSSDLSVKGIYEAQLNETGDLSNEPVLIHYTELDAPRGVEYVPTSDTLYFSDSTTIWSLRFYAMKLYEDLSSNSLQLAVDTTNHKLFWVDTKGTISFGFLNGTVPDDNVLYTSPSGSWAGMNALAFDQDVNNLYWSTGGVCKSASPSIYRGNVEAMENATKLYSFDPIEGPIGGLAFCAAKVHRSLGVVDDSSKSSAALPIAVGITLLLLIRSARRLILQQGQPYDSSARQQEIPETDVIQPKIEVVDRELL